MSGNSTPAQLNALVSIVNRKSLNKILTGNNFEVLSVKPYSSAISPHNTVVEIRVDTLANSPAIAIADQDRYVKRKVHVSRIDLKDIAEFRGIPKNELGQYAFEDPSLEGIILELDANIQEDELEAILVDQDTQVAVIRAKPDSLGYVGSLTIGMADAPVDNRTFVTAANEPKLAVYAVADMDPVNGPTGTPLSSVVVGQNVCLLKSAINIIDPLYYYIRTGSPENMTGGFVGEFSMAETFNSNQPTFTTFKVTEKVNSTVLFELGGNQNNVLAALHLPVNAQLASITAVNFDLPSVATMNGSNTDLSLNLAPTLTSNIPGYVGQKYEWSITSTSNKWKITTVPNNENQPYGVLEPTGAILKDEVVKIRLTVDGVQSAEKSITIGAYLTSLTITDPGTITSAGDGTVNKTLAFVANPSTTEPKTVTWSVTSGTATINATTGVLTATLDAGETRTVNVSVVVANRTATRTLTLTRPA